MIVNLTPEDIPSGDDALSVLSRSTTRRNMIASYSDLNLNDINRTGALTVDQYLQGRVSGLYVVNRSGSPGSGAYLALRGVNSINTGNQPLILLDGIPVTSTGIFNSNLAGFAYNPLLE